MSIDKGVLPVLNGLLVDIVGVPQKYKIDPYSYTGNYSFLNKLLKKYSPEYIHFVLDSIRMYKQRTGKSINKGYILIALKESHNRFSKYEKGYRIVTRRLLEQNGATTIPPYMLTVEERRLLSKNNVSAADIESVSKMLGIGGV